MNKADLARVTEHAAPILTDGEAERIVDAIFDAIGQAVARGDRVLITGFGGFSRVKRRARIARNPRTGDVVPVPACAVPRFTPGEALRRAVADGRPTGPITRRRPPRKADS